MSNDPFSASIIPFEVPEQVRAFAENQPVTSIVNAVRALFAEQPVGTDIWIALAWCGGILAVSVAASGFLFHRRIR